jgi:hypothetical protein
VFQKNPVFPEKSSFSQKNPVFPEKSCFSLKFQFFQKHPAFSEKSRFSRKIQFYQKNPVFPENPVVFVAFSEAHVQGGCAGLMAWLGTVPCRRRGGDG